MPLGLNRHGDYRNGTPIILPKTFGTPITEPHEFGNPITLPHDFGNDVTWLPNPAYFGNVIGAQPASTASIAMHGVWQALGEDPLPTSFGVAKKTPHMQLNPDRSEERRIGKECRSRWSP